MTLSLKKKKYKLKHSIALGNSTSRLTTEISKTYGVYLIDPCTQLKVINVWVMCSVVPVHSAPLSGFWQEGRCTVRPRAMGTWTLPFTRAVWREGFWGRWAVPSWMWRSGCALGHTPLQKSMSCATLPGTSDDMGNNVRAHDKEQQSTEKKGYAQATASHTPTLTWDLS